MPKFNKNGTIRKVKKNNPYFRDELINTCNKVYLAHAIYDSQNAQLDAKIAHVGTQGVAQYDSQINTRVVPQVIAHHANYANYEHYANYAHYAHYAHYVNDVSKTNECDEIDASKEEKHETIDVPSIMQGNMLPAIPFICSQLLIDKQTLQIYNEIYENRCIRMEQACIYIKIKEDVTDLFLKDLKSGNYQDHVYLLNSLSNEENFIDTLFANLVNDEQTKQCNITRKKILIDYFASIMKKSISIDGQTIMLTNTNTNKLIFSGSVINFSVFPDFINKTIAIANKIFQIIEHEIASLVFINFARKKKRILTMFLNDTICRINMITSMKKHITLLENDLKTNLHNISIRDGYINSCQLNQYVNIINEISVKFNDYDVRYSTIDSMNDEFRVKVTQQDLFRTKERSNVICITRQIENLKAKIEDTKNELTMEMHLRKMHLIEIGHNEQSIQNDEMKSHALDTVENYVMKLRQQLSTIDDQIEQKIRSVETNINILRKISNVDYYKYFLQITMDNKSNNELLAYFKTLRDCFVKYSNVS